MQTRDYPVRVGWAGFPPTRSSDARTPVHHVTLNGWAAQPPTLQGCQDGAVDVVAHEAAILV
jgi:hypothetical protein